MTPLQSIQSARWPRLYYEVPDTQTAFSLVEAYPFEDTGGLVPSVFYPFNQATFIPDTGTFDFEPDDFEHITGGNGAEGLYGSFRNTTGDLVTMDALSGARNVQVYLVLGNPDVANWTQTDFTNAIAGGTDLVQGVQGPTDVFTYSFTDAGFTTLPDGSTIPGQSNPTLVDKSGWVLAILGDEAVNLDGNYDTFSFVDMTTGVTASAVSGTATVGAATKTFIDAENLTGSSFADVIEGDAGGNVLRGLGGNDVFYGAKGAIDSYVGGAGLDTVDYSNATAGVYAWFKDPAYQPAGIETDDFISIERLVGSNFDDILRGSNITGTREWLEGGAGDDLLIGDAGIDYLTGGTGDDTLNGGTGYDYAMFNGTQDEFSFVTNSNGKTIVTHLDGIWGVDTLENIQVMRFDDGDVMLGAGF